MGPRAGGPLGRPKGMLLVATESQALPGTGVARLRVAVLNGRATGAPAVAQVIIDLAAGFPRAPPSCFWDCMDCGDCAVIGDYLRDSRSGPFASRMTCSVTLPSAMR